MTTRAPEPIESEPLVPVTSSSQHEAWWSRRTPPVEQVREGLWSIPLPNPHSGIRYVLCYVVEHDEGLGLVDPGWSDDLSWEALTTGLASIGRRPEDVTSMLVTHCHPDHLGGAARLSTVSGAPILMHEAELALIPERFGDPTEIIERTGPWLVRHGCDAGDIADFHADREELAAFARMPRPDGFLADGDALPWPGRDWRVVHTPGHTPGHLCVHAPQERLLLSGDHLLPRITPTVSAFPRSGPNPLLAYLGSLGKAGALDVDEVLPAHEWRFSGLAARAEQVAEHHAHREEEIVDRLRDADGPMSTADLSRVLTWSRPWPEILPAMRRVAVAETAAHLVLLESRGAVERGPGEPIRWSLPAPQPSADASSSERSRG